MEFPKIGQDTKKAHWNYADKFGTEDFEYIKTFVQNKCRDGYHTHSFYELNIVFDGEGYHYFEKMPYLAKRGNVFLIPPYVNHGYVNQNNLSIYHMLIHRDFIENCFQEFRKTEGFHLLFETEPYLRAHYEERMFLELSEEELSLIQQDAELIKKCETMNNAEIFVNAIAKKMLCYLCMLVLGRYGIEKNRLNSDKRNELVSIADCLNYIHGSYDDKITIAVLAEKVHMSRSTFIRRFTKVCGCPPHKYIQQYRIKKANEYLAAADKATAFVAQECGFYDASHMKKSLKNTN